MKVRNGCEYARGGGARLWSLDQQCGSKFTFFFVGKSVKSCQWYWRVHSEGCYRNAKKKAG